jgi:hypothetical protein
MKVIGDQVAAADHRYPRIVTIACQQLLTVRKEGWKWEDIILKDYALVLLLEEPGDSTSWAPPATEVCVSEQRLDFTGPVHLGRYLSGLLTALRIVRVTAPRTVPSDVEARRSGRTYCRENAARGVRSIKDQEQDCCAHRASLKNLAGG